MTISAVIFDIGNVLIRWNPEQFYDGIIGPKKRIEMFAETSIMAVHETVDAGAPFRETIYDLADEFPHWAAPIKMWHDNWNDMAGPTIDHTVALNRALRAKGVKTLALTNFGVGSLEISDRKYDYLQEFDKRYVSGAMNVIKPNPRIYEMLEADCDLPPETLLFTDDRIENIQAATTRGWQTHHFTDPQGFAKCLVDYGLLTPTEAQI